MTAPDRLRDLLPAVVADLAARHCPPHPITDLPCRRDPCDGQHSADGRTPWTDEETCHD